VCFSYLGTIKISKLICIFISALFVSAITDKQFVSHYRSAEITLTCDKNTAASFIVNGEDKQGNGKYVMTFRIRTVPH
jgi:hypothetical protein